MPQRHSIRLHTAGGVLVYRAACSCGWESSGPDAEVQASEHRAANQS